MMFSFKTLLYAILFIGLSSPVYSTTDLTLSFNSNLNYNGPADKLQIGEQIGPTWVAEGQQSGMCRVSSSTIKSAVVIPHSSPSGQYVTLDGVTYIVFDTGTPGIGWAMGVKDTNAYNFSPLLSTATQWFPAPGTPDGLRLTIGGRSRITLIKTGQHLQTGQTTLNAQTLATIICYDINGVELDRANINLTSRIMNVTAAGCTVNGASNRVVEMGKYTASDFPNVGSTSAVQSLQIPLTCDPDINLKVTVSDQSDIGNISDTASLLSTSTASGLGVQVLFRNNLIHFGPDNSSAGNTNQFDIGLTSTSSNTNINVPFDFRYIRTGPVTAGAAHSLIGITFSYQ